MRNRWNAGLGAMVLVVALPAAAAGSAPAEAPPFPTFSATLEPLRGDFNRDAGRVRLLLLLDPT